MAEYQEVKRICEMSDKEIRKENKWKKSEGKYGLWCLKQVVLFRDYFDLWRTATSMAFLDTSCSKKDVYHEPFSKLVCEYALQIAEKEQ